MLDALVSYLAGTPEFEAILAGTRSRIGGLSPQAAVLFAAAVPPPWVLVFPDVPAARRAALDMTTYGVAAAFFPPIEVTAYHGVSPGPDLVGQRQGVLAGLASGEIDRVITSPQALIARVPSPAAWGNAILRLEPGRDISPTTLAQELVKLGLKPAAAVTERGEFSRRGGILDCWPSVHPEPLRVEWFGDQIESIRTFEPLSQRSLDHVGAIEVWPTREILLPADSWPGVEERIRQAAAEQSGQFRGWGHRTEADRLLAVVADHLDKFKQFRAFEGCEVYASFFHEMSLFDQHLSPATRLLRYDPAGSDRTAREFLSSAGQESDRRRQAGLLLEAPVGLLATAEDIAGALESRTTVDMLPGEPEGDSFWWAPPALAFPNQFAAFASRMAARSAAGERLIIASTQPQRIFALLDEYGCHATVGARLPPPRTSAYGGVWIFRESLDGGYEWPALRVGVYSDREIFGWHKKAAKLKKIPFAGTPIASISDLDVGQYVVHSKHGIGVFGGLTKLQVDSQEKEYLLVRFLGDDRLYVPVDQIGLLHRYRAGPDGSPKLSKMGGAEWETVKKRVRKSVQQLAEDLIALYAKRLALPGYAFPQDDQWQRELEEAFPYQETVDQLRAIEETKADMEGGQPMDRLVCGDVGFGKTEVAIRAAFKAVLGGKQAAILAPTTLLAQQHFHVFRSRYAPYPIRVALLSRFRTAAQQRESLRQLALGEVDIVVGTHRLLSKDVHFKSLGLLVVDEEHRFGVGHKERLKAIKTEVDVLSMSATPIPRTLYLALSGARDMSLITTPPANRLPIKTTVGPWDPEMARTAILRELERGGQVFFLHNRVEDLDHWAATVQALVPQCRLAMAHGQMPEARLEDIMLAFVDREYDLLVATTIIESGLDIPSANTILIHDADKLGLATLYQLRGRVGRSAEKAYCYCFFAFGKELTPEARDRLDAIQQHTALGSGYQIALRDLEIRGVGNLLGAEQHGQMLTVGYDTYMQLLEEAIAAGIGHEVTPREETTIDLPVAAFLPDDWFQRTDATTTPPVDGPKPTSESFVTADKMVQYRRLAQVQSLRELELLSDEWQDRFGQFPLPTKSLLRVVEIKLKATELRIASIKGEGNKIRVALDLPQSVWAELQLHLPGLAKWQWATLRAPGTNARDASAQASELTLDRSRLAVDQQLGMIEKLLDACRKGIANAAVTAAPAGRN